MGLPKGKILAIDIISQNRLISIKTEIYSLILRQTYYREAPKKSFFVKTPRKSFCKRIFSFVFMTVQKTHSNT